MIVMFVDRNVPVLPCVVMEITVHSKKVLQCSVNFLKNSLIKMFP